MNTTRTFTKFAKAAENCRYKNDFQYDLVQCEKAYQMGGKMRIEAECWLNLYESLEADDIHSYVRYQYRPGDLDPFRKKPEKEKTP